MTIAVAVTLAMAGAGAAPSACAVERERDPGLPADGIHPAGFAEPSSAVFHGRELQGLGWDFQLCARCHGEDFTGGAARVSCTSCHEEGPTACTTCHDDDLLTSGAHATHLGGAVDFDRCDTCHDTPAAWNQPGHLDEAPAEVHAFFDPATATCDVQCHGGDLDDPAAAVPAPSWHDATGAPGRCGSCHGLPPGDGLHFRDDCATCHSQVIAATGTFVRAELHNDGLVQVGRGEGLEDCSGCHGDASSPAPPDTAHQLHLLAPHRLSSPVACAECHRVPATVGAAGHIDSPDPVEVFDGAGSVARSHGADPVWDRAAATCRSVACHGGGSGLFALDAAPGLRRTPSWSDPGIPTCGSCHGVPPLDGVHDPRLALSDCASCHPSFDAFGNALFEDGASRHVDGVVDVR